MSEHLLQAVFARRLEERRERKTYREQRIIDANSQLIDFSGNDYLGLAKHSALQEAGVLALEQYGSGAKASHLVSGHLEVHAQLEDKLAKFTKRDAALVFSSGYMANVGVIGALIGAEQSFKRRGSGAARNTTWTIFQDKLNHASLIDAIALSNVASKRYRHSDVRHLETLLADCKSPFKLVVTDGIFSMDGNRAPVEELAAICKRHDAMLMVDDAHGLGAVGQCGGGTLALEHCSQGDVPILVGTFGKSFGCAGAFVAGPSVLIEGLIQFARTYIYTTAMPPANAAMAARALALIEEDEGIQLREKLARNIRYFREQIEERRLAFKLLPSASAIQPLIIGDNETALKLAHSALNKELLLCAIRAPTVPEGTARLRIALSAAHNFSQIDRLCDFLMEEGR